tara:strand:+ start:221 stop:376 length:156 start_codon:yes stop_codon:yes gene_type:complete
MKKMAIIFGFICAVAVFLFASFLAGPALLCAIQTIITETFLNEATDCWRLI